MSLTGYEISSDPAKIDVEVVYRFLNEKSYWSSGIPRDIVEKAIKNSLCFGIYSEGSR